MIKRYILTKKFTLKHTYQCRNTYKGTNRMTFTLSRASKFIHISCLKVHEWILILAKNRNRRLLKRVRVRIKVAGIRVSLYGRYDGGS